MMKTWLMFMTMVGAGAGIAATAASHPASRATVAPPLVQPAAKTGAMPIDKCIRACLACDRGSILACAVCALCSEPAVTSSTSTM
jgi:hypothetical protein